MREELQLNLVRKIAWSYHKSTGLDYDDLFQEASLGGILAKERFDPERGVLFSTFCYHVVRNHLNTFLAKQSKQALTETEEELYSMHYDGPSPLDQVVFHSLVEELPEDARLVCELIFNSPLEFLRSAPRTKLVMKLREKGWTWSRIWNALRPIKTMLKSCSNGEW